MELTELVKKAEKGDNASFSKLIKSCEKDMYRVAEAMLKNDDDALDCIQETIMRAYKNINKLEKKEYFKTWLIRILINTCNDTLERRKKIIEYREYASPELKDGFNMDEVEVRDAVDKLEPELKLLVILYYFEDMSVKDIAGSLEIAEGTVKSRLSRARNRLKEILENNERSIV